MTDPADYEKGRRVYFESEWDALVAERDEALRELTEKDTYAIEQYDRAEAAEAERDEAKRDWQMYQHEVGDMLARAEAAEAEVKRLREALAPFAGIVFADSDVAEEWILAARAALSGGSSE
jgi:hypothetical protein